MKSWENSATYWAKNNQFILDMILLQNKVNKV